jgi:prevent-host-death family protein
MACLKAGLRCWRRLRLPWWDSAHPGHQEIAIEVAIMDNCYSVAAARNNLAKLLHDAEAGHTVKISRRGEPVAVILSLSKYERMKSSSNASEAYRRWRGEWKDFADIDSPFEDVRDAEPGRDFSF